MFASASHSLTTTGKNKKQPSCQQNITFWHIKTKRWSRLCAVLALLTDMSFIVWWWLMINYPRAAHGHTDAATSLITSERGQRHDWQIGGCVGRASLRREHRPSHHPQSLNNLTRKLQNNTQMMRQFMRHLHVTLQDFFFFGLKSFVRDHYGKICESFLCRKLFQVSYKTHGKTGRYWFCT